MKPIKLTVQAFGPFSGYQEIDFTKLGAAPLFLINGPTGSGKSSILDAICFALYGETTGSERTGDQMRCDHAKADCLTEVSFEFSLADKHYKVVRSPDQQVPKKRGDGTTKKTHSAILYQLQGDQEILLANKPTSVGKEVVNLIGLDVKQFRQVMVLPQGKFRELLIANSKEREQIFGQLFQTHIYVAIERALFEQAAGIRKAKDEFDNQIKGALDVANVTSEQALSEQLELLSPQVVEASEHHKKAQLALETAQAGLKAANELNVKFERRNSLQGQLNQHLSRNEEIEQLKQQRIQGQSAAALNLPYREWQQARADEKQAQQTLIEQQSKWGQAKHNLETQQQLVNQATLEAREIPTMTQSVFQLAEVEKHLLARDEQQALLNTATAQVTRIQQQLGRMLEQQQKLSQDITDKQSAFQLANERCLELPLKQQFVVQLEQKIRVHHEIVQTQTASQQFKVIEKEAERDLQLAKSNVIDAKRNADELEFHWHSSQAALLAQTLQNGQACPVCGSKEHPSPALFNGQEVSKEQVDLARHRQQQCMTAQDHVQAQWQKAQTDVAKVEQALLGWQAQLGEDTRPLIDIQTELAALQQEITQLVALKPEQLNRELQALQQALEAIKPQQAELESQLATAQQSAANLSGALNSLHSNIPKQYQHVSQVLQEKQVLEQRIAQLHKTEQQALAALEQVKSLCTTAESGVTNAHERVVLTEQRSLTSHAHWEQMRGESPFADDVAFLAAQTTKEQLLEWELAINQFNERTSSLNGALETLNEELQGLAVLSTDELQLAVTNQTQSYQDALSALTQLQSQVDNLIKVQLRLKELYKRNEQLEQEYQVIGTLSDIANGRTGVKVSLHRFVLGVLLDDVLIQASQRLRVMSKGRYELRRKEDRAKGNAGSGLDLMVEDGYSGKLRDVATLSGGESFMAALALALGVSDVVQSYSGGIRLDTLFIDEGFGSLDPESLDLAIQTLIDLQQGGRTIGLISHVSELKEQMSLRLDVEAKRTGSTINVVCP